jgi:hypothetical protein
MVNGHPLVEVGDGRFLLDTGLPKSCCESGHLVLCGKDISLLPTALSLTPRNIGDLVGARITGLLGMDILGEVDFIIDVAAGEATFTRGELDLPGMPLHVKSFIGGLPVVTALFDGRALMCVLDTAARLSYLGSSSTASRYPVTGRGTDLLPTFGEFETETRSIRIDLGGRVCTLQFGSPPRALMGELRFAGIWGVIGSAVLEEGPILFSMRRSKVVLGEPGGPE